MRGAVVIGEIEKAEGERTAMLISMSTWEKLEPGSEVSIDGQPRDALDFYSVCTYRLPDSEARLTVAHKTYAVRKEFEGDDWHAKNVALSEAGSVLLDHVSGILADNPWAVPIWRTRLTLGIDGATEVTPEQYDEGWRPGLLQAKARVRFALVPKNAILIRADDRIMEPMPCLT